jgi:EAL domain-containing protein (putative c-di-GMP-specific phosphodiesterase class I)
VTGFQLQQPDFIDLVRHALHAAELPPDRLTLELTETMLIDDSEKTRPLIDALGQLGVRIALDDFGTGYSSLTYLRRLPIDTVKIDRSFVHALGTSTEDSAIVGAVIRLARDLNLGVVAEGVETLVQLDALRALGCRHAQGYLFAKPTPPEHLEELLAAQV